MESAIYQPPIRRFVDDNNPYSSEMGPISTGRYRFLGTHEIQGKKSRCLVLRKGRVDRGVKMEIQGEEIPSIVGNPIKCLGKWFKGSLKDKESIDDTKKKLLSWLRTVEGSGLPGKYKA